MPRAASAGYQILPPRRMSIFTIRGSNGCYCKDQGHAKAGQPQDSQESVRVFQDWPEAMSCGRQVQESQSDNPRFSTMRTISL